MEEQTPPIANLARDGNQEKGLAQISGTRSVTAPSETPIARQPIDPPEPGPVPEDAPVLSISMNSPKDNSTISGLASQGGVAITATGSLIADGYTVETVTVSFGGSGKTASRTGLNWTCTSNKLTTSGSLTITATVKAKLNNTTTSDTRIDTADVIVVITDDVDPALTITKSSAPSGRKSTMAGVTAC